MAYFARLTVSGITACEVYFFYRFGDLLGPSESNVDVENLVIVADYFKIAGPWMQARSGIVSNTNEYYTGERWKLWKNGFRMLATRSDQTVRACVDDILQAMS